MRKQFLAACILFLSSCSSPSPPIETSVSITGREPERFELYRIKVPSDWKIVRPDPNQPLTDSRTPLLECLVDEEIKITIHNFPLNGNDRHIPPQAQVHRWKQQLKNCDPTATVLTYQSFSGYAGLLLEAEGEIEGAKTTLLGWALQIGADHDRALSLSSLPEQMRADITIKAIGPSDKVSLLHSKLIRFARSFELVKEIPQLK